MACRAKKSAFQPTLDQWRCPACGVGAEVGNGSSIDNGFIVEDPDPNCRDDRCTALHEDDYCVCYVCGFECTGAELAERVVGKSKNKKEEKKKERKKSGTGAKAASEWLTAADREFLAELANSDPNFQIFIALEELSELIQALIKKFRGFGDDAVVEETADVLIMCEQLAAITGRSRVQAKVREKMERLRQRVKEDRL